MNKYDYAAIYKAFLILLACWCFWGTKAVGFGAAAVLLFQFF